MDTCIILYCVPCQIKRIPNNIKQYYKNDRIVICLKTKSNISSIRTSKSIYQKLDNYWTSIRLTNIQVPAQHMLLRKQLDKRNQMHLYYLKLLTLI